MPRVTVSGLPAWLDAPRLLGPGDWRAAGGALAAELPRSEAAALDARLRGVVLGGERLVVEVVPPLRRPEVRAARLEDARARRETTPGFDRPGTKLDEVGRWSLTPAALALALGRRAGGQDRHGVTVLDACCGCGGNAIGFARAGCRVVAVDTDGSRLALARHNARAYGVADRIRFVEGRAQDHAATAGAALWFVDPPWSTDGVVATTVAGLTPLPELLALPGRPRVWAKLAPAFPASVLGGSIEAVFGEAPGDARRVKFLLVDLPPA